MILRRLLSFLVLSSALSLSAQPDTFFFRGKEKISLRDHWKVVMGSFLTYEEVIKDTTGVKVRVPGNWDDVEWGGRENRGFGYGTYYATIILGESINQSLALELSEISLAYRLFVNDKLVGQLGQPGKTPETTIPRLDFRIFDFQAEPGDTLTVFLHVSNFSHRSGGIWYAPGLDYEQRLRSDTEFGKTIKLLIIGFIIIAGLFQLYIFSRRRNERFGLYFFFVSATLVMLSISRGDMPMMDLFPSTSWATIKKTVYIAIFLMGPANGLFLYELFPKYFNKRIIWGVVFLGLAVSMYTLIVSPRLSHVLVSPYHILNVTYGIYLLVCLIRVAVNNVFGGRFLLTGYFVAFATILHDILSSQHIITGYSFDMIYIGVMVYISQLIAVIAGRYIAALKGKEELSAHLKMVNADLEKMVERRTKALSDQNELIEIKNRELHKALVEKDHLMAVVAHDLKAPLSSIMGISDLMMSELKGQSAEFNKMIQKVTLDGRKLIENLTELKVYEQEDFEASIKSLELSAFFNKKELAFTDQAEKKGITLEFLLEVETKKFRTDESILDRIVDNLLSNAIKFTPKEGKVTLEASLAQDQLQISVRDSGPGFKDWDKERLFQKFQRLSARPTAGESSTGLGLSIVKTLVEKMDGTIQLNEAYEMGAEFIVIIPEKNL